MPWELYTLLCVHLLWLLSFSFAYTYSVLKATLWNAYKSADAPLPVVLMKAKWECPVNERFDVVAHKCVKTRAV